MKQLKKLVGFICTLVLVTLVGAGFVAMTTSPAEAKVGGVYIKNSTNHNLTIWCDYGKEKTRKTLSPGQNSQQKGKCTASNGDTDQLHSNTKVCVKINGTSKDPVKNGYYYISAYNRVKIFDLTTVGVFPGGDKRCDKHTPYYKWR